MNGVTSCQISIDALNELNEEDREAVMLRYFSGKKFAEVGSRLGVSENTARMRVERAVEKVRGILASRGATVTGIAGIFGHLHRLLLSYSPPLLRSDKFARRKTRAFV